jgi:hypothetical protein
LKLNLILSDEGLALVVNLLGEFGRDGMVSSCVLDDQALVTLHALEDMGLLYRPFSNICPLLFLSRALRVLLGMGWLPPFLPVVCELLDEIGLDGCGLRKMWLVNCLIKYHTILDERC